MIVQVRQRRLLVGDKQGFLGCRSLRQEDGDIGGCDCTLRRSGWVSQLPINLRGMVRLLVRKKSNTVM